MATSTYDEALRRLLAHEGGYTNHPSDPGGPTNFGITIHDYRKYIDASGGAADVRQMTVEQAKAIYRSKYWNAMRCDELPAGVDFAVFDYGVNSGIGRAPKVLKRILDLDASTSAVTPQVIEAAKRRDARSIVGAICDERLRFLKSLRTWPVFGNGWGRRVSEVRMAALEMIVRAPARATESTRTVGRGQVPEPKAAREAMRTGGGAAVAATGAAFWEWIVGHPVAAALIAGLVIAAMVYGLHRLKAWHKNRQETPMAYTPAVPETTLQR
jgi:lysozyme family protein